MTARRLALAWCAGASLGLAVGFLLGESFRDGLDLARLAHPEPREGAGTGTSATEDGSGAQTGAQWLDQDELHARPDYQEAFRRAEGRPWEPGVDLVAYMADHDIPAQRDDEPCPQYSPGGGIPCSVTGEHTAHIFLGTHARDAKNDADERIE